MYMDIEKNSKKGEFFAGAWKKITGCHAALTNLAKRHNFFVNTLSIHSSFGQRLGTGYETNEEKISFPHMHEKCANFEHKSAPYAHLEHRSPPNLFRHMCLSTLSSKKAQYSCLKLQRELREGKIRERFCTQANFWQILGHSVHLEPRLMPSIFAPRCQPPSRGCKDASPAWNCDGY